MRIGIDWPDPQMAQALVQATVQNFIDARHNTEAAAITEAISILPRLAAALQTDVDSTIAQLREEQARQPPGLRTNRKATRALRTMPVTAPPPVVEKASSGPSPAAVIQLSRLNAALDEKRQEIKRLEGLQRQQSFRAPGTIGYGTHDIYRRPSDGFESASEPRVGDWRTRRLSVLRTEAQYLESQYDALQGGARGDQPTGDSAARAAVVNCLVRQPTQWPRGRNRPNPRCSRYCLPMSADYRASSTRRAVC